MKVGSLLSKELSKEDIIPSSLGEVVQAACLAHDIGNPPFGHAGEDAIKEWFKKNQDKELIRDLNSINRTDFKLYDGNAMGFRILTKTEYDSFEGGMRLTYPTLATMMKYPWSSLKAEEFQKDKFSCFSSDIQTMNQIASKIGLLHKGDNYWSRHPLAYLVEAADDICYSLLDLEDARELRIVTFKFLNNKLFKDYLNDDEEYNIFIEKDISERRKLAFIRGKTIDKLIEDISNTFIENYKSIMDGSLNEPLTSLCSEKSKTLLKSASAICKERVYNHHRKIEIEVGCYTALGAMLDEFYIAAKYLHTSKSKSDLNFKSKRIVDLLGINAPKPGENFASIMMRFLDYLGGMTDNFATHIASQILGHGRTDITR